MGTIIDLEAWRNARRLVARDAPGDLSPRPLDRLEAAVARLDRAVARGTGRLSSRVERELLLIIGLVAAGRSAEAADRAERLAERLEHPSARAQ